MNTKALEELVQHVENYIECLKQFNQFANLARAKKFSAEEENHFLEVKSVLVQELELILAAIEASPTTREDVHTLVGAAPSLRFLSESQDGVIRNIEGQWHRVYMNWQSILGQLKVQLQADDNKSALASLFSRGKAKK
ncbi:MAG: hypothetical protein RLY20_1206 [Verrucomicrobiota bacterium]|jgi:hypothetical protein